MPVIVSFAAGSQAAVALIQTAIQRKIRDIGNKMSVDAQILEERGRSLVWLAQRRAVSCDDLAAYNSDTTKLHEFASAFAHLARKAGAKISDPPTPKLFSRVYTNNRWLLARARGADGVITACTPDFSYAEVWDQPDGSPVLDGNLGNPVVLALIPWIGRAVVATIAAVGLVFALIKLRELLTASETIEQEYNEFAARLGSQKVEAVRRCTESAVAAAEKAGQPVNYMALRQQCEDGVSAQFPPDIRRPSPGVGLGKTVIYVGLGVALIVGSLAGYQFIRNRG
jgi:hypothetical protein